MDTNKPYGLYLFQKERKDLHVLKDMLQLVRTHSPNKSVSFAYIEAQTSLIPDLTLWENLQLELGGNNWKEFCSTLDPQWLPLANLLKDPHAVTDKSEPWEKFTVSLLKGVLIPSQHLLIDMNEDHLSPFMVQNFKKFFLKMAQVKQVYLASAYSSLWLD